MSRRVLDWPTRLNAYLDAARSTPFELGPHDCVRFAAGAVEAVTGRAVALPLWTDAESARVALHASGGLEPAVDARLPRLSTPKLAQRGDIVLLSQEEGRRMPLAVCIGDRWAGPGLAGVSFGPMAQAVAAWRVE